MRYKDSSFRGVDGQFCVFRMDEEVRGKIIAQLAGEPLGDADSFLGFGYVDPDAGLTVAVLAPANCLEEGVAIQDELPANRVRISIADLMEADYFNIGGTEAADIQLRDQYAETLAYIEENFTPDSDVKRARGMRFLDGMRRDTHPDDILVHLQKPGFKEEARYLRLVKVGERNFTGRLLTEPGQDFGVHKGDEFTFVLQQLPPKDKAADGEHTADEIIAVRAFKLTRREALSGVLLEKVRSDYKKSPSFETWERFLEVLANCYIWIPCNATLSKAPATQEEVQLTADILTNGQGKFFFPVFSSPVEMGEDYAKDFSLVEKPFKEAVRMAQHSNTELTGIVFNAFSDHIVVGADLFDFFINVPLMVEA